MKREKRRLFEAVDRYLDRIAVEQADRTVYTARYALAKLVKAYPRGTRSCTRRPPPTWTSSATGSTRRRTRRRPPEPPALRRP